MPGELDSPYRRDPFTGDFVPRWNEGDEMHQATLQESNGRYGFFLFEAPQLRSPSSFVCAVLADEYDTTGTPLRENARLDAPDADEFRVDYDADTYFGTGFVEVHASRVNQYFMTGYHGLGTPPRWLTHLRAALSVAEDFAVAGDLAVGQTLTVDEYADLQGSVSMASDVGATIDANNKRIQNVGTATDPTDGLSVAQAPDYFEHHEAGLILTGSGNWEKPLGVTKVFFVAIGPGGNGATDAGGGGGGGGGASVCGVADLDALGAGPFAYVVGTPGNHTTIFGCTAGRGSNGAGTGGGAAGTGTVGASVIGRATSGAAGANGSGPGGGGGGAAGGLGGVGGAGSGATGGAAGGFFGGAGGLGVTGSGNVGADYGGGGGGGTAAGGNGANGFIMLFY